jgi:hypothetical protein
VDFGAGVSVFVALQLQAVTACEGFFEASNGSEIDDLHFGEWQNSLLFEVKDQYLNDTKYPLAFDTPQVAVVIQDVSAMAHVRSNSNGVGDGGVALPAVTDRPQVFIGKSLYADCGTFKGTIGEVLLYSRGVNDAELLQIEGYLQDKWACCTK